MAQKARPGYQLINITGVGPAEFKDSMTDDEIRNAIENEILPNPGTHPYSMTDNELVQEEGADSSMWQNPIRDLSLLARGAIPPVTGAVAGTSIAGPAGGFIGSMAVPLGDALNTAWNAVVPEKYELGMVSDLVSRWMDRISPRPENRRERILQEAGRATGLTAPQVLAAKAISKGLPSLLTTAPKTQVAVSGPSAAAGEYVTEETENPYLGLLANVSTSVLGGSLVPRPKPKIPSRNEIRLKAKEQYDIAENAGVVIKPENFKSSVDDMIESVKTQGYHPRLHPKVSVAVNELSKGSDGPLTLSKLDQLRRIAKSAAASNEADERRVGNILIDLIDDYVDNLSGSSLISGDSQVATNALKAARVLWKTNIKAETVEDILEQAKNQVGANYTSAGLETALRQQFKKLANNRKKFNQFSEAEKKAILQIARGTKGQNALRLIGKLAPTGILSSGGSVGLGYWLFGGPGAVGIPALGFAARESARKMAMNKFEKLDELIRLGLIPKQVPITPTMMTRGLLSSDIYREQE